MRWDTIIAVVLASAALVGCGGGGSTTTVALTPSQYDSEQSIGAYVKAIQQTEAPFTHPPSEPTNYAKASALLHKSLHELESLTPPPAFRAVHAKYERGVRGELAAGPLFVHAQRTHNSLEATKAEAKVQAAEHVVREALQEAQTILNRCEAQRFSC